MSITNIESEALRKMQGKEGLVLRGCGGDLQEWVDGISNELKREDILSEGSSFGECFTFQHGDVTCLLFPFEGADLDLSKLAMWRLRTRDMYGGTWLSDFVSNCLGGFVQEDAQASEQQERQKPDCPLIGKDSNIFNLVGLASRTLKRHGMKDEAAEMSSRVFSSGSYDEALCIIGEYVNITSENDAPEEEAAMDMGVS